MESQSSLCLYKHINFESLKQLNLPHNSRWHTGPSMCDLASIHAHVQSKPTFDLVQIHAPALVILDLEMQTKYVLYCCGL